MNNEIAKRIKISRQIAGLKQRDLADKVGVSLITIARWENPESGRSPNTAMINKIAEATNTSVGYLMGIENMPQKQNEISLISDIDANDLSMKTKTPDIDISPTENQLVFRDANRVVSVPNTPETRAMFERLVMSAMNSAPAMA